MEEQARRRRASQPPEDPTPGPSFPSLKEGMAKEETRLAEEAKRREAFQQPENPTPGRSYPTYERILAQVGELDLQSQLRLLEELAALVRQKVS